MRKAPRRIVDAVSDHLLQSSISALRASIYAASYSPSGARLLDAGPRSAKTLPRHRACFTTQPRRRRFASTSWSPAGSKRQRTSTADSADRDPEVQPLLSMRRRLIGEAEGTRWHDGARRGVCVKAATLGLLVAEARPDKPWESG